MLTTAAFLLIAFIDEGNGATTIVAPFETEAACEAAIAAMPKDKLNDEGTDDGIDWAVCVSAR